MSLHDSPNDGAAVVMRGVGRTVVGPDGASTTILRDISLRVGAGGLLHVVGPSGSGKTSLIRLLNRLDDRSTGDLEVLGRPLEAWSPRELRQRVAMVFQEPSLLGRSVRENLRLPFEIRGESRGDGGVEDRIEEALELAGCAMAWLDREASHLSAGQRQRVTLARALVTRPDVLLLDEPTAALDPGTAEGLLERLAALRASRSLALIMTTHRLEEARRLGGRMAILIEGRLAALGDTDELVRDPPDDQVRQFLRHGSTASPARPKAEAPQRRPDADRSPPRA